MKVLWIAPYPNSKLSPELTILRKKKSHDASWIVNLSDELAKNPEVELHIVVHYPYINKSQIINKNNITFHIIKYNFPFTHRGFPSILRLDIITLYYPLLNKIKSLIKKIKPDIIHVHGTEGGGGLIRRFTHVPTLVSVQGIIHKLVKYDFNIVNLLQIPVEYFIIMINENFGCRTHWDKATITKINSQANIYYLPEAINPVFFQTSWENLDNNNIVFLGSLVRRKGIELLIDCLAEIKKEIPKVKLKIIGSGSPKYIDKLIQKLIKYSVYENVTFLGEMSAIEIATEFRTSNIFVLPTLIDNSPNSLLEAMALGIPCVASNAGGISSLVDDGIDGLIFQSEDKIDLTKKIINLLKNRDLQKKLSANAMERIRKNNFPATVARITLEKYKEIVEKNV